MATNFLCKCKKKRPVFWNGLADFSLSPLQIFKKYGILKLSLYQITFELKEILKYRTFWKSAEDLKKITYPKTDFTSNYIKLHVIFYSL